IQRHYHVPERNAVDHHREQYGWAVQSADASEYQRERRAARRPRRPTAGPLFRYERLYSTCGVYLRQRRPDNQYSQRWRQKLRHVVIQTVRAHRADARAVPRRSLERLQHAALRGAEHERHFDDVRTNHVAGQFSAATAVWVEVVVVK